MKSKTKSKKRFGKSFFIFFLLVTISTVLSYSFANGFTFGCSTSPFSDFKSAHCYGDSKDTGTVRIYSRDWVAQPTTLLRLAAIESELIYDDHEIWMTHPFTPLSLTFPVIAPTQIHTYADGTPVAPKVTIAETLFLLLEIIFVPFAALGLDYLWQKNKTTQLAAIFILLFVFKYVSIITLPIFVAITRITLP